MLMVYIATVIVAGAWAARMFLRREKLFQRTWFDIPIALFALSQVAATAFSIHPHTSIFGYYTRFHGGLLSTFSYMILAYGFATHIEKKDLRKLWLSLFTGGFLVSLIAIPEHFGHSFNCLLINSSHQLDRVGLGGILSSAQIWSNYNASCWVQDVQNRVFATFGQPNWLAAYAVMLIPVGLIHLALHTFSSKRSQWFVATTVISLFASLLFTKSRSGILGMALGFAILGGGILFWRWQKKTSSSHKTPGTIWKISVAVMLVFALWFGTPYSPSMSALLTQSHATQETEVTPPTNRLDEGGTDSGEIRKIVWLGALKVWQRYPIFGSGVETFAYSYYKDRPASHNLVSEWDFLYNKAHNEFLNFLATTGIVGLVTYVGMLGSFVALPFLKSRSKELSLAVAASVVGLSVSNFFGFSTVTVAFLMFVFPMMIVVNDKKENLALSLGEKIPKISLGIITVVTLLGIMSVWRMWQADYLLSQAKQLGQSGDLTAAVPVLQNAISLSNNDTVFYDELALDYARLSVALALDHQATSAGKIASEALRTTDDMLLLNPVHPLLYKTKLRVLLSLAQLDPKVLDEAKQTVLQGIELAPTDPKFRYNLGLLEEALGNPEAAKEAYLQTIALKPNYEEARLTLAELYEAENATPEAVLQYRYILEKIQPANTKAQDALQKIASASTAPTKKQK